MLEQRTNLTRIPIPSDLRDQEQDDNGISAQAQTTVIFRDHTQELIKVLKRAFRDGACCFGAVAWLTDPDVLREMARVPTAMLVQKEDFLRPDSDGPQEEFTRKLREAYDSITTPTEMRYNLPGLAGGLSVCSGPAFQPVRCVGERPVHGQDNPRMHNKFLVFARCSRKFLDGSKTAWKPYLVWTGSANLTAATDDSWENSLLIENREIAQAYLNEWIQLFALSEPLDWDSQYVNPEWRVGT